MCFVRQRRALFRHRNFQKWSEPGVFCTFWLGNVLRANNGVKFFISRLASWLRTRRFSEPTFRPSGATNHWKNTVFRDFPTFSRICIFFLLTLSLLLFFPLIFLSSNSFSSTLLSSNLSLLSASSLLCFLSVHTSSTAQGGGGSFKNRKPIGEIGCCESGMAERIHWWTERCLRPPLFLSLSLTIYLPTSLSSMYLSIFDLSIYPFLSFISLPIYLSTYLPIYRSIYLSVYLSIYLSIDLSIYLSINQSIYLSVYLSIYLSMYLSLYVSIYLSMYRSMCLSMYLSIYPSVYRSVCLSVYLSSHLSNHLIYPAGLSLSLSFI